MKRHKKWMIAIIVVLVAVLTPFAYKALIGPDFYTDDTSHEIRIYYKWHEYYCVGNAKEEYEGEFVANIDGSEIYSVNDGEKLLVKGKHSGNNGSIYEMLGD